MIDTVPQGGWAEVWWGPKTWSKHVWYPKSGFHIQHGPTSCGHKKLLCGHQVFQVLSPYCKLSNVTVPQTSRFLHTVNSAPHHLVTDMLGPLKSGFLKPTQTNWKQLIGKRWSGKLCWAVLNELFCIVFTLVYIWITENVLWPPNLGPWRLLGPVFKYISVYPGK